MAKDIMLSDNEIDKITWALELQINHAIGLGHHCHIQMAGITPHYLMEKINHNRLIKKLESYKSNPPASEQTG